MTPLKLKFGLAIALGLTVTIILIAPRLPVNAQDTEQQAKQQWVATALKIYNDPELTYDEVIMKYHDRVNAIFNSKIGKLQEKLKATDKTIDAEEFPACNLEGNNLTTYCLGSLASAEYAAFAKAMQARLDEYKDVTECLQKKADEANKKPVPFDKAANAAQLRAAVIVEEVKTAKRTLDLALAAYNEFYWAWPLHLQYQDFIKALEKYRDELANFRSKVEHFPGTFIDATTTQCS